MRVACQTLCVFLVGSGEHLKLDGWMDDGRHTHAQPMVHTAHCIIHTAHCIIHTAHCIMHTAHVKTEN